MHVLAGFGEGSNRKRATSQKMDLSENRLQSAHPQIKQLQLRMNVERECDFGLQKMSVSFGEPNSCGLDFSAREELTLSRSW